MNKADCSGNVISSTHWDREWYHTVEKSRFRLVRGLDRALSLWETDPEWLIYHTDGQVQLLHDYLEVRPGARPRVEALVRAGKLRIGPFLVQPDEQIPDGETLLRNLQLGLTDAEALGGAEKFGYLADNFGHVGQLPQILLNFGIDAAAFWRGCDETELEAVENCWVGADGSRVLAILMPRSYAVAANYGPGGEDDHNLEKHLELLAKLSRTGEIVLNDNIDHALPPPRPGEVWCEMRRRLGLREIRHTGWSEVRDRIRGSGAALPELFGELRFVPSLDGTFSARLRQKQRFAEAEHRLLRYAEPLAALAARVGAERGDGFRFFLERAWRMIVRNATHDSIGGAHTDAVARDVDARSLHALEIADGVVTEAFNRLTGARSDGFHAAPPEGTLAVFNPLPRRTVRGTAFTFVTPNGTTADRFEPIFKTARLYDGDREIPMVVEKIEPGWQSRFFDRKNPEIRHAFVWHAFAPEMELPPLGFKTFRLEFNAPRPRAAVLGPDEAVRADGSDWRAQPPIGRADGVLENEFLRIRVFPDGSLTLFDKRSGRELSGLNILYDRADNGTQYGFSAPPGAPARRIAAGTIGVENNSFARGTVIVDSEIEIFDERAEQPDFLVRRLGSSFRTRPAAIRLEFTLARGSRALEVRIAIPDHRGAGHRLRAHFPVLGNCCWAGTPFDLTRRDNVDGAPCGSTAAMRRTLTGTGFQRILAAGGLLTAARGLYEYEANWGTGELELTLLRAAGTINYDFDAYGAATGGLENGECVVKYALIPYAGAEPEGDEAALQAAEAYLSPPESRQFASLNPLEIFGLELSGTGVALSCDAPDSDGSETVRIYNRTKSPQSVRLIWGRAPERIVEIRADGVSVGPGSDRRSADGRDCRIEIGPKRIVTLRAFFPDR